jgi:hypothetical protein
MTEQPNPERVLHELFAHGGKHCSTIAEHYGVTDEEFNTMTGSILALIPTCNDKTKVIDAIFPKSDAETRAKIWAFHAAWVIWERGNDRR